jgi:hypothetical protein
VQLPQNQSYELPFVRYVYHRSERLAASYEGLNVLYDGMLEEEREPYNIISLSREYPKEMFTTKSHLSRGLKESGSLRLNLFEL